MNKTIKLLLPLLLGVGCHSFAQDKPGIEKRVDSLLKQMTLTEKLTYIGGTDWRYIRAVPRLHLPAIAMSDGPVGVGAFGKSTAYPAGILAAATWDTALVRREGIALGRDARARGVHILLAPGVNIYRAPMCGRNFEYFGEDPYLASRMAVSYIEGVQSQRVAAVVKHFAANNAEMDRKNVSNNMDERTLQEIYLPAFKAAVTEANVACVMDSYNLINGVHSTQNPHLNLDILKNGWGFKGLVMSDWHSTYDGVAAANGGLDLEMPAGDHLNPSILLPAIQAGKVSEATIDDKVRRILRVILDYGWDQHEQIDRDIPKDDPESVKVALAIARSGIVLLKNAGQALPLTHIRSVAVIGPNADQYVAGGGSSYVDPFHSQTILAGIRKVAGRNVKVIDAHRLEAAKAADAVIVCVGFNKDREQENADRSFALPEGQDSLIRTMARLNKRLIVVLEAGGNVAMQSWLPQVSGLLYAGYPGQEGGQAIAEILFGKVNPSGKLPATFEKKWEDNPAYGNYYQGSPDKQVNYAEGIFIGYRGYEHNRVQPQFPFGYGLSYTQFSYSHLKAVLKGGRVRVTFEVHNTGNQDGAEIAELYVHQQQCSVPRPDKELKGFAKVFLKKGETKQVTIHLGMDAFSYYREKKGSFGYDPGKFDLLVGASSADIRLKKTINITQL